LSGVPRKDTPAKEMHNNSNQIVAISRDRAMTAEVVFKCKGEVPANDDKGVAS
jgi:hypothetical protein